MEKFGADIGTNVQSTVLLVSVRFSWRGAEACPSINRRSTFGVVLTRCILAVVGTVAGISDIWVILADYSGDMFQNWDQVKGA